jgi:hypothetical protein
MLFPVCLLVSLLRLSATPNLLRLLSLAEGPSCERTERHCHSQLLREALEILLDHWTALDCHVCLRRGKGKGRRKLGRGVVSRGEVECGRGTTCPLRDISWSRLVTLPLTILSNIAMFLGGAARVCSLRSNMTQKEEKGEGELT